MLKDSDLEVRTADEAISIINANLKDKSKCFEFFLVLPFPQFERNSCRKELAITGIKQLHSMIVSQNNLYAKEITCTTCTSSNVCDSCKEHVFATSKDVVNPSGDEDEDDEVEDENNIHDPADDGQSDLEADEEESDEAIDGHINVGTIVWGKHGRIWYPALVVSRDEVPEIALRKLGRNLDSKILIKWWGENNYSALRDNCVEQLARNRVDEYRAHRSNQITKMYHLAVAELID